MNPKGLDRGSDASGTLRGYGGFPSFPKFTYNDSQIRGPRQPSTAICLSFFGQ
jgi:hypothetical protein